MASTRTLRSTCPSPAWAPILGARVLAEFGDDPRPLRRRQGPQELRRHQPDHPRLRQEEDRRRPVRAQRPAHRRAHGPGLRRAAGLTRRPRLLRPATRPRRRPQRRPAPARQPARRHPARLPQNRHRSTTKPPPGRTTAKINDCRLTSKLLGCLPGRGPDTRLIGGLTYQGVVGVGRATRPDFHACEASLKETGGS